jgi:hypothetical protein
MLQARICVLEALFVGSISPATAEDYVCPTGVTVLSGEQLLNQIIGNTLVGGNERWVEYFELPTGDAKKGRIKEKAGAEDSMKVIGRFTGH